MIYPKNEKDIVLFTKSNIPDPGLRRLIFGTEDINYNDDIRDNTIASIYKSLSVAWIFAFIGWKNDMLKGNFENKRMSANALRIHRSFNSVYTTEKISLDLMLFTLTEMHLDVINNRKSKYKEIINDNAVDFTINQLRQLIRVWKHSYKLSETNVDVLMRYYCFIIDLLPVLNNLQIAHEGGEVFFIHKGQIHNTLGIVKYFEEESPYYYYLSNFHIRQNNVNLTYIDFIGGSVIDQTINKSEFFQSYNLTIGGEKISEIFAQKLYSVDYKYIHYLSLAISDALDEMAKERLFNYYVKLFPDAFLLMDDQKSKFSNHDFDIQVIIHESNWDNIITFLMLEAGPSSILEKVINRNLRNFEQLTENLEVRFWGKIKSDKLIEEFHEKQEAETTLIRRISSDFKSLGEIVEKAQGNLMVQTIIGAVTNLVENNTLSSYNAAYVETLNMRIRNLENTMKSEESNEIKARALNKALEKTFRFLIIFYYGLISYAEELELVKNASIISSFANDEVINNCEKAFLRVAAEKAQECKKYSVGQLINSFREMALLFSTNATQNTRNISKKGELLKTVIGRDYLCDIKVFNDLSSAVPETMNFDKHYIAEDGSLRAILSSDCLSKAKELLYFFIYNKDFQDERRIKQLISVDPIYPYVVRYCIKSENRDGYHINNYVVNMSNDEMDMEVKLLTEKNYEINELYYCIPNLKATMSKWWIKPFLIKCRDVDELFLV